MRTSWILIAPGLVRQVGERRLHRDQPVEQVLLVVLEADIQDVGLATRRDVARHLERHRRLAGALRAADQQQLPGPQPAADRLVERGEPERDRLVFGDVAAGDLVVEIDEHVERRPGHQAAGVGVEAPGRRLGRRLSVGRRFRSVGGHGSVSSPDGYGGRRVAPGRARITHPDPPNPHSPPGDARQRGRSTSSSNIRAKVRMPVS